VARITEREREQLAAVIRENWGTKSLRDLASFCGISATTVRKIAGEIGLGAAEARTRTQNAIEAKQLSNAERRARLAERMLEVAEQALADMTSPHEVYNFGGKDNTFNSRTVSQPSAADRRNLIIIAGTALDKHKMLDQYDTAGRAAAQVDAFLQHLTGQ
jgi:hypothetical protein